MNEIMHNPALWFTVISLSILRTFEQFLTFFALVYEQTHNAHGYKHEFVNIIGLCSLEFYISFFTNRGFLSNRYGIIRRNNNESKCTMFNFIVRIIPFSLVYVSIFSNNAVTSYTGLRCKLILRLVDIFLCLF